MNHRCGKRYPLFLDAKVQTLDNEITLFKTCDISVAGMGLTCQFHRLKLNQVVEISLSAAPGITRRDLSPQPGWRLAGYSQHRFHVPESI